MLPLIPIIVASGAGIAASVVLHARQKKADTAVSKWLKLHGGPKNAKSFDPNCRMKSGEPALICALKASASDDILKRLIRLGANVDVRDAESTPAVILAVKDNRWAIVELMISVGVDLNAMDAKGNTVVFYTDDVERLTYLSKFGAVMTVQNAEGQTPLFHVTSIPKAMAMMAVGIDGKARDHQGNRAPIVADFKVFPVKHDVLFDGELVDAVRLNQVDRVQRVLEWGANPNSNSFGGEIKTCILRLQGTQVLELLCQAGLDMQDDSLMYPAIHRPRYDIVKILRRYGMSVDQKDIESAFTMHSMEYWDAIAEGGLPNHKDYLLRCTVEGGKSTLQRLLDKKFDKAWTDELVRACILRRCNEWVSLILERGGQVSSGTIMWAIRERSALSADLIDSMFDAATELSPELVTLCITENRMEIFDNLLERGVELKSEHLSAALSSGRTDFVQKLCECGTVTVTDQHMVLCAGMSSERDALKTLEILRRYHPGFVPEMLDAAMNKGNDRLAKRIVDEDPDLAVVHYIKNKDIDSIRHLIQKSGLKPNEAIVRYVLDCDLNPAYLRLLLHNMDRGPGHSSRKPCRNAISSRLFCSWNMAQRLRAVTPSSMFITRQKGISLRIMHG